MQRFVFVAAALLSGCSPVTHTYVVETRRADSPVTSATVSVCRQAPWTLERSGTRFAGTRSARCEGSGYIRLRHQDGTETTCPVGYVTTMDQTLPFTVKGRSCEPLPWATAPGAVSRPSYSSRPVAAVHTDSFSASSTS